MAQLNGHPRWLQQQHVQLTSYIIHMTHKRVNWPSQNPPTESLMFCSNRTQQSTAAMLTTDSGNFWVRLKHRLTWLMLEDWNIVQSNILSNLNGIQNGTSLWYWYPWPFCPCWCLVCFLYLLHLERRQDTPWQWCCPLQCSAPMSQKRCHRFQVSLLF